MSRSRHSKFNRAFTLVEVLASIAIIALILPTVMYGLSLASSSASIAKHRTQATTLAQAKLDELVVAYNSGNTIGTLSGDFSDAGYPGLHWTAAFNTWNNPTDAAGSLSTSLEQLDVTVSWRDRNQNYEATLTTLVYQGQSSSLTGGGL